MKFKKVLTAGLMVAACFASFSFFTPAAHADTTDDAIVAQLEKITDTKSPFYIPVNERQNPAYVGAKEQQFEQA